MKPKFALSLSFEGISLLHRAAGGWRTVGDVALDAPDMGRALAGLREKALLLEPGGITTKLIIPNDQIRYDTLQRAPVDEVERLVMVRAALDGATPYDIDELSFDTSVDGPRMHIAAVARETLAEAEAFAVEHQFNPVSFVAIPGDNPFLGEPFFGPSQHARTLPGNGSVEPDGVAVVVVGPAEFPQAGSDPEPSVPEPGPAPDPDPQPEPEPRPEPEPQGEPVPPPEPDPAPPPELPPDPAPPELPGETGPPELSLGPTPGFASRRRRTGGPPPADGAARSPDMPAAPRFTPVPQPVEEAETGPAPSLGPVETPDVAPPVVATPAPPVEDTPPALSAEPRKKPVKRLSVTAPSLPGVKLKKPRLPAGTKQAAAATLGRFLSRRGAPPPDNTAPEEPERPAPPTAIAPPPVPPRPRGRAVPEPDGEEARRMTVFGARDTTVGGKPRHLGLILTALLLMFLAGVAAWAALFLDDGIAGLFGDDAEEIRVAVVPAVPPPPEETEDPLPASLPPAPGTTDTLAALPPGDGGPDLTDTDAAVLDALREDDEGTPPDGPARTPGDPAAYAATGIWDKAPEEPQTPSVISLNDLYVASIDRSDLSQDAVALQTPQELDTDQPPGAINSPAEAGTEFFLDPNGLVFPSPDGAVTPDGVVVYLGPPPVKPPATPARPDPEAEDSAVQSRLAAIRPRLRPDGLVENAERATLGGLTREELGKVRPKLRPDNLKDADEADETPTSRAVARSRVPKPRPASFANLKRSSEVATQPTEVAAVAPATVTPRIPSSASVARQATVKNAINLRNVNLIGVYGTPSNRRALVRLPSGRYKKVKVGDRIDGGRIVAIGDSELRYQKGGRNLTLKVPSS